MAEPARIVWLTSALARLQAALRSDQTSADRLLSQHVSTANRILQQTFAGVDVVVVRERFCGYSAKPDIDVLLVETIPAPAWDTLAAQGLSAGVVAYCDAGQHMPPELEPASYIVKVFHGEEDSPLQKEWLAWNACRPPGLRTDNLLTGLRCGAPGPNQKGLVSLVYNDGHSMLGTGEIVPLDNAVVDCCLFGTPTLESLELAIRRLFNGLNGRFYTQSYIPGDCTRTLADMASKTGAHSLGARLRQTLPKWKDTASRSEPVTAEGGISDAERLRHRREALALLARHQDTFIDPCDFLHQLLERSEAGWRVCPRLLHGCSHGDLHGRNILVSLVNDEVSSLVVFDYEKMDPHNVVGWDFVKLETELKVRVYPHLFSQQHVGFIEQAHDFEVTLDRITEALHDHNDMDQESINKLPDPAQRHLARLILAIRARAKEYLGVQRCRSREWLEEYYFLLCCYGVYAVKFPAYGRRELLGAYVSAGVAARRMDWPWRNRNAEKELPREAARAVVAQCDANTLPLQEDLVTTWHTWRNDHPELRYCYHSDLEFVRVWSRAALSKPTCPFVNAARYILQQLQREYPHVAEFDEELALVCRELDDEPGVKEALQRLDWRYDHRSEETLCRFGAALKKRAHNAWNGEMPLPEEVRRQLSQSLDYYQRAYGLRRYYYPGVNVAALKKLLGDPNASVVACDVLKSLPDTEGDTVWILATRGELELISGQYEHATQHYSRACAAADCDAHARRAMRKQVELLRLALDSQAENYWSNEKLDAIFGREPS